MRNTFLHFQSPIWIFSKQILIKTSVPKKLSENEQGMFQK